MIFKCKNCGGNSIYSPERKSMYCPYCESVDSEEPVKGSVMSQCANCGAPMEVPEYTSASRCAHCGSYIIFEEKVEGEYRPRLVLPFQIGKEEVKEKLYQQFSRKLFLPSGFYQRASLDKVEGFYIPFWLYDLHTRYSFKGLGRKVRTWRSGDTEYTEFSYYHVARDMEVDFSRVPADASKAMPDDIVEILEPFQYEDMQEFEEKYLSGFLAEYYNEDDNAIYPRVKEKTESNAQALMQKNLIEYTDVTNTQKDIQITRNQTEYVLMPIWRYTYHYKGKAYQYYINAQTGKIYGGMPLSAEKIFSYTAAFFASSYAIAALVMHILEVI